MGEAVKSVMGEKLHFDFPYLILLLNHSNVSEYTACFLSLPSFNSSILKCACMNLSFDSPILKHDLEEPEVLYPVRPHTFIAPSPDLRRTVVSYWRKYVYLVMVKCLRDLSLRSVVSLTDRLVMTITVYCGRKSITQQQIFASVRSFSLTFMIHSAKWKFRHS